MLLTLLLTDAAHGADRHTPAEPITAHPDPSVRLVDGVGAHLHRDRLGCALAITDGAGRTVERRSFRPYGEMTSQVMRVSASETRGWIGERYDAGAGLQYLGARDYDSRLGLFLQPDWLEVTEPEFRIFIAH